MLGGGRQQVGNLYLALYFTESKTALKNSLFKKLNNFLKTHHLAWDYRLRTFLEEWRNEFLEERKKKSSRTVFVPQHGTNKDCWKNSTYSFYQLLMLCHLVRSVSYRGKI